MLLFVLCNVKPTQQRQQDTMVHAIEEPLQKGSRGPYPPEARPSHVLCKISGEFELWMSR
jgi:hypothetical protein